MKKFSLLTIFTLLVLVGGFLIPIPKAEAAVTPTVTAPNGGEHWRGTQNITWTSATTTEGNSVAIQYCSGDNCAAGAYTTITASTTDDGSYAWNTATVGDATTYKIRISDVIFPPYDADISNATFTIDNTVPDAFTLGAATSTGGTVVAAKWNSTNTGVSLAVPIANDASLVGGTIQIQAASTTSWGNIATTSPIAAADTTQLVSLTAAQLEAIAGFGDGTVVSFKAIITDYAGNYTTSTASASTLTVDQAAPTISTAARGK